MLCPYCNHEFNKKEMKKAIKLKRVKKIKMTFGKYEGTKLGKIPTAYLCWLYDNVELKYGLDDKVELILKDEISSLELVKNYYKNYYNGFSYTDCGDIREDAHHPQGDPIANDPTISGVPGL